MHAIYGDQEPWRRIRFLGGEQRVEMVKRHLVDTYRTLSGEFQ